MILLWYRCLSTRTLVLFCFFFFNDTATTEIYTLSLHDALPIYAHRQSQGLQRTPPVRDHLQGLRTRPALCAGDRKSTRLNSSHLVISYAVFCLKKKKKHPTSGIRLTYSKHALISTHSPHYPHTP